LLRSCTITSRLPYHLQDKAADTTHPFHGTLFWSLTADRDMVLCSPISRRSSLGGYWRSASPRTYYQPDLDVEPQVVWRQGTRSNRKHTFAMRGFCGQRQCVRRLLQRYGWKQSIFTALIYCCSLGLWEIGEQPGRMFSLTWCESWDPRDTAMPSTVNLLAGYDPTFDMPDLALRSLEYLRNMAPNGTWPLFRGIVPLHRCVILSGIFFSGCCGTAWHNTLPNL